MNGLLTQKPRIRLVTPVERDDEHLNLPSVARFSVTLRYPGIEQRSYWCNYGAALRAAYLAITVHHMEALLG
jgi:hypothetical protein